MPLASRDRRGVPPASGLPWSRVWLATWSGERWLAWYGPEMPGFEDSFERSSKVAGGELVLRGTRVPVRSVLPSLAEGASYEDVLRAFPTLTPEHLRAVVAFAASLALKGLPLTEKPELEAAMADSGDELDDDERGRLEAALDEAIGRFDEGDPAVPADDALRRLGERLR